MNIYVLFSLLFFLAPGGCPMYSIDLSTLEVPNDFQNELTLQSMLNSELHQYRNKLNQNAKINVRSAFTSPLEHRDGVSKFKSIGIDNTVSSEDEETKSIPAHTPKFSRSTNEESRFLGTNLFGNYPKKCFSTEDIALMSARKDFESLIPKAYPRCLLSDSVVYMLMKYFNTVNQIVKHKGDGETRRWLQRAYYDALGSYLRHYLLPVAQLSYYAGRLKLCTVERLVALYRQCKIVLNTNGNGWRTPLADILGQLQSTHISPIKIEACKSSENDAASCTLLDQSYVSKEADITVDQMIVTLPHLESVDGSGFLGNIFIPFRQRRIYNLQSPNSAFILVKFFKIVTNCHRFQGLSQRTYNLKLRNWIRENLEVHYKDEIFYPGLGGILQIYETLTCPKKSKDSNRTEGQESLMGGEEDSKDYQMSPDEMNIEGEKCAGNSRGKKIIQSRKQSRSPKQSKKHIENEVMRQDPILGKTKIRNDDEDCIECDDERYVAYVAAFLAVLLLLLLLLICLCMRRSSKDRNQRVKAEKGAKPEEKPPEKEEEIPPPYTPPPQKNKGCWNSMFKKKDEKQGKEKKKKHREKQPKGMALLDNRNDYYTRPLGFSDSISRKTDRIRSDAEHIDSLSSTSSLGCQFPRKCIPIKLTREKHDEYYTTSEKKHSNSQAKQKEKKRQRYVALSDETQDRFIAKPHGISEDQSSPGRRTSSPKKLVDQKRSKSKHRLASEGESKSKKRRHDEEAKIQTEKKRLREECEEYKKRKQEELDRLKESETKVYESEDKTKEEELPKKRGNKTKTEGKSNYYSPDRAKGGSTSKNSLSWETTFDDDSS